MKFENRYPKAEGKPKWEVVCFAPVVRGSNSLRVLAAGETHEIELIGTIGKSYWDDSGITEKEFRDALKQVPVGKPIILKINSEGGSVQEGLGIYNSIKERRDEITCRITGYAMSIASVFPLAAGKVVSPRSAIWMMHKASSWSQGNADDMRQAAKMLDAHDETLVDIYVAETGKSQKDIRAAMEAVTWIKGADAVAFGLADEGDEEVTDRVEYRPLAQAFLARCKVPTAILECIQAGAPLEISAVVNGGALDNKNNDKMNKKTIVALLKKHGIEASETETEEQLQAKLDKIPLATATPAAAAAAQPAAAGNELIDIRAELAKQKRERITDKVALYVDDQKITVAEIPIFVEAALKDEGGTFKILDDKPMAEVGGEPVGFNRIEGGEAPGTRWLPGQAHRDGG